MDQRAVSSLFAFFPAGICDDGRNFLFGISLYLVDMVCGAGRQQRDEREIKAAGYAVCVIAVLLCAYIFIGPQYTVDAALLVCGRRKCLAGKRSCMYS